jgi:putative membrane-bound dehydrogenase-like protein
MIPCMHRRPVPVVAGAVMVGVLAVAAARLPGQEPPPGAGTPQVAEVIRTFEGRGVLADDTPPTPPEEAVKQFRVREEFEVELVAAEPDIGQPLFVTWDSRGRLWVVQYLQYQFPAGLTIVEYDDHLRARFDQVPAPPPHGTPGADRITVFEDTTGDGIYDAHRDVITGLNIATSVAIGRGGLWVANPPYLLFYPDVDGDGVPDADPDVRLSGFGLEDTHAVMNNLEWGPDGWLYGVNGSTTTGAVTDPATGATVAWQGQMVWRYHPDHRSFEIYAEGGGNTFSLEIDAQGRVFSGTNTGQTRGMYYPQGSYGVKSWGKHGPLTNPYAFGYLEHMAHEGDMARFPQAFSIYEGGTFPEAFTGAIIAPNSLHNRIWLSRRLPHTSTFRTVDEEPLAETDDRWFRPVSAEVGPDGAVYVTDWYDTRLSHVRPVDDWHKASGRVYRFRPRGTTPVYGHGDIAALDSGGKIALFDDPNRLVRRRAVLELGWSGDRRAVPALVALVRAGRGQASLEALWALHLLDGLTDALALEWLEHADPHVRRWVVRLTGDRRQAATGLADGLRVLASREPDVEVRAQLAASARRLPAAVAIPIVRALLARAEDLEDLHLPLLNWWAVEAHADEGRGLLLAMAADEATWAWPLFREAVAGRLMRRYAMAGGAANLQACADLLATAPDPDAARRLMTGLQLAFQGTTIPQLPPSLTRALDAHAAALGENALMLEIQRGSATAVARALEVIASSQADPVERLELARLVATTGDPRVVPVLLGLLGQQEDNSLKRVALQALARFDDESIATAILSRYGATLPAEHDVRSTADRVLASRPAWARLFLRRIDLAHIKARDISADVVQLLALHRDPGIDAAIARHWPELRSTPAASVELEIRRIRETLAAGEGRAAGGRAHFLERCAACHTLFDEGGSNAPDLTRYARGDLDIWIPAIVDPSREIREEYLVHVATLEDGRVVSGVVTARDPQTVTIRDASGQDAILQRADVRRLEASPVSMMPPGLLAGLDDQALRDLFAYLRRTER